mgnify:CR=1 FL=1
MVNYKQQCHLKDLVVLSVHLQAWHNLQVPAVAILTAVEQVTIRTMVVQVTTLITTLTTTQTTHQMIVKFLVHLQIQGW